MFRSLWHWILRLFGHEKTITSDKQQERNAGYTREYEDIEHINFNAIISNKLATLAVSESSVDISEDNRRAQLLDDVSKRLWSKAKKIVARTLGTGGCIAIPYVTEGHIYFDIVSQDRLNINAKTGDKITSATILADTATVGNEVFYRWVTYTLNGTSCTVKNRVTNSSGTDAYVSQWENISDVIITGVDRLPFAYIKSPVDNRLTSDNYGVPITYGCDDIIEQIKECLKDIRKEFKLKRVRLQVDERMFTKDKDGHYVVKDDLFMASPNLKNDIMFNIFDPPIRDSSFYNRLTNLFDLLEKQIGTSKGILTTPESRGATATEIKAGMYDTYSIIDDVRKVLSDFWDDFIYACDVLANCYNLSPAGEYDVNFDWSYSMIESSAETWQQLKDGQAAGVRSKAELRAWQTGESLEDAQKAVDEIAAKEPTMATLIGNAE